MGHLVVLDVSGHRPFANVRIARRDLDAFRPPPRRHVIQRVPSPSSTPLTRVQRRALYILLTGVGLWATDLLHHIQPVYIGLGLVVLFLWPRWGPLRFGDLIKVRFALLAYIVALLTLGHALDGAGFNHLFIAACSEYLALEEYGWLGKHLSLCLVALPLDFLMDIAASSRCGDHPPDGTRCSARDRAVAGSIQRGDGNYFGLLALPVGAFHGSLWFSATLHAAARSRPRPYFHSILGPALSAQLALLAVARADLTRIGVYNAQCL